MDNKRRSKKLLETLLNIYDMIWFPDNKELIDKNLMEIILRENFPLDQVCLSWFYSLWLPFVIMHNDCLSLIK